MFRLIKAIPSPDCQQVELTLQWNAGKSQIVALDAQDATVQKVRRLIDDMNQNAMKVNRAIDELEDLIN